MIQIRLRLDESIHASQLAENYPYLESGSGGWKITLRTPPWRPPMDVYETEEYLVVRMEIAGMRESDFNIELDGRLLSIRAHAQRQTSAGLTTRWRSRSVSSAWRSSCRWLSR